MNGILPYRLLGVLSLVLLGAGTASAHVIVRPDTAGVASFQNFSMGVPVERDSPTTALRLLIPSGLKMVTPTVKLGWKIDVKKDGTGDTATVTEIDWTGGSIPAGQRDDFTFSAQVPASAATLQWKAYQTYADGTVVSWDKAPNPANPDDDSITPYSKTAVVNDLAATPVPASKADLDRAVSRIWDASGALLVLVLVSLGVAVGRRRI